MLNTIHLFRVRVFECTRAKQRQSFQTDVTRTVPIRIVGVTTRLADKLALCLAVCLGCVSTLAAPLGGEGRVDPQEWNSGHPRLVGDQLSQLGERPAMQLGPFPLPCPDPRPDSTEILDGNRSIRALCGLDYAFGNNVIGVAGKKTFTPISLFEEAARGLGSLALKFSPERPVAVPYFVEFAAGIGHSVGIKGDFDNSHVNTETVNSFDFLVFGNVHGDVQEPLSFAENQVGLTARISKQGALLFSADKRHLGPSFECPNTYGGSGQIQRQNAGIIGDTAVLAKDTLNLLVEFVGVNHLGIEQADDLCGERKFVPDLAVEKLVHRVTTKLFQVPSQLREPVGRIVHRLQSIAQSHLLFWSWKQFNLDGQFQREQYISNT